MSRAFVLLNRLKKIMNYIFVYLYQTILYFYFAEISLSKELLLFYFFVYHCIVYCITMLWTDSEQSDCVQSVVRLHVILHIFSCRTINSKIICCVSGAIFSISVSENRLSNTETVVIFLLTSTRQ